MSNIYYSTVHGVSDTKQGMQKHIKERKQFKINRNKKQLSSLAKQAKTREQAYRRVHK
ncbi:Spiroplasmavirus-related protein [Spiroplasma kunkelii CR2-3x]|uniref:Spiroplasmavirus-related protein n=1 Tax=Spiroplasma kunkelii CR2-3x TaxID=273035 RepID=A0A0K2JHT7_SPIKU|nr:Spiroplasmavirus-related protein [Spiroplasma kunkelii CR2-3x]